MFKQSSHVFFMDISRAVQCGLTKQMHYMLEFVHIPVNRTIPAAGQKLCLHPNLYRTTSSPVASLQSSLQGHLKVVEGHAGSLWDHTQGRSNDTRRAQPRGASVGDRSVAWVIEDCPNLLKWKNMAVNLHEFKK